MGVPTNMMQDAPEVLFRYRHLQGEHRKWTKQILTDSILHFANPPSLNDPFDCKVHFKQSFSTEELRRKHVNLVKRYLPNINRNQCRSRVKGDLDRLDRDELIPQITKGLQDGVDNCGVLSLSATDSNILLWSHYAASHTGLCLKFIATNYTEFFGAAQPVEYKDAYPTIDLFGHTPEQQIQAFLLTKATDWKYEEEWRIIDHDGGTVDKVFPEELLTEVILGARMIQEDKEAVAKWLSKRKTQVLLSQATIIPGSFALKISPLI
jgi:hypothetical protein